MPKEEGGLPQRSQAERPDLHHRQPSGPAYMGLQLLEREKRVLADVGEPRTAVQRVRIPARKIPETAFPHRHRRRGRWRQRRSSRRRLIDLSDGLASDLVRSANASACGRASTSSASRSRVRPRPCRGDAPGPGRCGAERRQRDYELLFTCRFRCRSRSCGWALWTLISHITPPPRAVTSSPPTGRTQS